MSRPWFTWEATMHPMPTPQQLVWQEAELTMFLHFGMNTFTDQEWGDGAEDPAVFNPTRLDSGLPSPRSAGSGT